MRIIESLEELTLLVAITLYAIQSSVRLPVLISLFLIPLGNLPILLLSYARSKNIEKLLVDPWIDITIAGLK